MNNKFFLYLAISAVLLSSLSFAADPYFFKGISHVNGSLAPNGTIIEAFVPATATTSISSVTIGQGQLVGLDPGKYVISFEANSGDNVSFKVNGLVMIATNGTDNTTQVLGTAQIYDNFNLSINKSANGVACTYAVGCTGGFCVHSLCRAASTHCGDGYCDTGESCSSDNSACASGYACTNGCVATSTSGSTGGGSGGGTGTVTPRRTTFDEQTLTTVTANVPMIITIAETKLPVSQVVLTLSVSAQNVIVHTEEASQPAGASAPVSVDIGKVYKYVEIKINNTNVQVSKAKVKFKVEKTWLDTNNINPSTIALNRFVSATWTKLATTQVSEDSTYRYYEATTPGLSTFAITGEKVKVTACGNNILESGEECDGTQLAGQTCVTKGFDEGTLKCTNCRFDTSSCTSIAPGEEQPTEEIPIIKRPPIRVAAEVSSVVVGSVIVIIIIIIVYVFWVRPRKKQPMHAPQTASA